MSQLPSLADAPGTLREYETIYILKPDTPNSQLSEINAKVKGIIESMEGTVLKVDNWGKKKLAYEVKKQLKGIYLYWQYLGKSDLVAEVERNMRMMDPVIRYLTVNTKTDVTTDSVESTVNDETYEKAAITAADEEELMTGRARPENSEPYYADAEAYLGAKSGGDAEAPPAAASTEADSTSAPVEPSETVADAAPSTDESKEG